ncbi:MAG: alanine--tRNA ligase [Clostridiales bacterium]|nr:alanine--tRNA ligase [Clostridiales bacterium]
MKPFSVNELREMYLQFFESKGHLRLPSFSLVPQHDKSLLLINAGMSPMKPWFTGDEVPPRRRVTTCQKCIRTGDIENIGKTARHGTYFEMLGNFSFGDYFKSEAIHWAWEFLTSPDWVGIDPNRLYPSVYLEDDEAYRIWNEEMGIPKERIFKFGKEDNFWEHGSGPCGPCSEIYYDRGAKYGCGKPGCTVGCDCDRYMEVWNIVFSQFDNDGHNNYTELKQKNIDTGMGLERLAVVCQGADSLFDTDTVMHITNKVSEITGAHYGESEEKDVSLRIITDHIRSATMMISDGVLPSNEGRGYVLRRLLRRAARHGRLLGVTKPFLYEVCDTVIEVNKCEYTDLVSRRDYIVRIIKMEEESFGRTIDSGLKIFAEMLDAHKAKGESVFSGADAFKLYDTYGFPIDLTIEMCADEGMTVDEAAFAAEMEAQKVRAREARKALGDLGWERIDLGDIDKNPTAFLGYTDSADTARVLAIVEDDEVAGTIREGQEGILVLNQTPFYAEMGGQVGDQGVITCGEASFVVTDTKKTKAGKYLHYGKMTAGAISVDDEAVATIDTNRRAAISRAHSATHLMQAALQQVLGDHVQQAGSLVEPDYLRFDFTHFSAITQEELMQIESIVNDAILADMPIETKEMPIEEAKKLGAMALFSEKYGDIVRVVNMGDGYSIEFCGGTHLSNTAKIGSFHITSEGSIASGVRRIEATVGKRNIDALLEQTRKFAEAAALFKVKPDELSQRISAQLSEARELKKQIDQYKDKEALGEARDFLASAKDVGSVKVLTANLGAVEVANLRKMGDFLRDKQPSVVAVLTAVNGEKISFLCVCGKDAVKAGVKAGDVIKAVTKICGGSGGGKPDSAMGGGKDKLKIDDALAAVDDFVSEKLGL